MVQNGKDGICSLYQWGLSYDRPRHFVQSQWSSNKTTYLVYRIAMLLLATAMLMGRMGMKEPGQNAFFFIYLTNWGLLVFVTQQTMDLVLVLREYHREESAKREIQEE